MLQNDQVFLSKYNEIIKSCQESILKLLVGHMKERVAESDLILQNYKAEFNKIQDIDGIYQNPN